MKRFVLPALVAAFAATVYADNTPFGMPIAMPAERQAILARLKIAPKRIRLTPDGISLKL